MENLNRFILRNQPGYNEAVMRQALATVIPVKTIVIHCLDPRATEIPRVVAERLGNEVYPGEVIRDEAGSKVGSTRTLFPLTNAGGRAISSLQTISTLEYLFGVENVVVVHHSFCGTTVFTPDSIIQGFKHKHNADIASAYDHDSMCIESYEKSLKYDVELLRSAPGVPSHINIYGFFFNIDTDELIEVVKDIPVLVPA